MSNVAELNIDAVEKSTLVINVAFTDEDGNDLTPNNIYWTLTDGDGSVINSKQDQAIAPESATPYEVDIVLTGDDLEITGNDNTELRELLVYGDYDSSYGNGLTFKEAVKFDVVNLVAVS